ncbi:kinase-like protein [Pholiota conissans]|uniref:Kinase-like protein n=1 Tax=Pholiota conissans TaxID=109636 RepID=A0A9P6CQK8_9AGAR|nr:kinase-like protein [Pholiota conissans]
MSFPEEPLDLPPSQGGGYYPAAIHQLIHNAKYEIIRKLGYGPHSSTWLVLHDSEYHEPIYSALKIFTVAASEEASHTQPPMLKAVHDLGRFDFCLPIFRGSFWEQSGAGAHLCVVMSAMAMSARALQMEAEHNHLPVHVVQKLVCTAANALAELHKEKFMHGGIDADSVYLGLGATMQTKYLKSVLDSEPQPTAVEVMGSTTVLSQPLSTKYKWNDKQKKVVDWSVRVGNLGHVQRGTYTPEKGHNYSFAPETLLNRASCSPKTDIWMLGCLTYTLLTNTELFTTPEQCAAHRIATMYAILEDDIPTSWLSDENMKEYNTNACSSGNFISIEAGLADALYKDDVGPAAAFIKSCLRLDPQKRLTAHQCMRHEWLSMANACSCQFC